MNILSKTQIDFFQQNGYVILSNYLDTNEVESLRNLFISLFESGFWKNSKFDSPTIINDIYAFYPEVIDIIFKPDYVQAAKELLGEQMVCVPECSVHYNRYFDWHRDTAIMESQNVFIHKEKSNNLIQGGIYLQDNHLTGGGLALIPSSNKGADRFYELYYGSKIDKVRNKFLKLINKSIQYYLEENENVIYPPTKAGDVLFFDSQLDHRASFKRNLSGNAIDPKINKLAIFNSFCSNRIMTQEYYNCIRSPNEPYANFLKQTKAPQILVSKAKELNLQIEYSL